MKKNVLLSFLIIFFISFVFFQAYSQNNTGGNPNKNPRKEGLKADRAGDVYTALDYYSKYLKNNPNDALIAFNYAELLSLSREYPLAAQWYRKAWDLNPKKYNIAIFRCGQMLKMTGNYTEAKEAFNLFKKNRSRRYKDMQKLIKANIESCDSASTRIGRPLNVEIRRLDSIINYPHIDFSPMPLDDSRLLFASLRVEKIPRFIRDDSAESFVTRFYIAEGFKEGNTEVSLLQAPFNNGTSNIGNGAFNNDMSKFYFTQCRNLDRNNRICQLYVSHYENGRFSKATLLPPKVNLNAYSSTQPAVGADQKKGNEILYFVSDRPGGKGGTDLWYAVYDPETGAFSEPKNCGSKINTQGNEYTPYYDITSHRLYFSSDGRSGLGGYDIYSSAGEKGRWEVPQPLGYPINSSYDDLYYVLSPGKASEGYLVSNRPGGRLLEGKTCCDDIWHFTYPDHVYLAVTGNVFEFNDSLADQSIEKILAGKAAAGQNLPKSGQCMVSLYAVDKSDTGSYFLIGKQKTDSSGIFFFNLEKGNTYKLVASKNGYFTANATFSTLNARYSDTFSRDLVINKIPLKPIVIRNIYYPFDKYYLTDSAKIVIDTTILRLMQQNPSIIAEISSHTDSCGTDKYNIRLSQNRAQSVVNYLLSKGIPIERMRAKGYGETMFIAPNSMPDGSDNPEGRQKNRRTEFRVIGVLPQYSDIIYRE